MPDKVYLPPEEADAAVIKIGGECYERQGDSENEPTVSGGDEEFSSCEACEDDSSSSSGSPPCVNAVRARHYNNPNSYCFSQTTKINNYVRDYVLTNGVYNFTSGIGQWNRQTRVQTGENTSVGSSQRGPGIHVATFNDAPITYYYYKDGIEVGTREFRIDFIFEVSATDAFWTQSGYDTRPRSCSVDSPCDGFRCFYTDTNSETSIQLDVSGNGCCYDGVECTEGQMDCETGACEGGDSDSSSDDGGLP